MTKLFDAILDAHDVARINASFHPLVTMPPSEYWMTEEVNEGTNPISGWRIPAGSSSASAIELLNRAAELLLTKARELAQKYHHQHNIHGSLSAWQAQRITAHINANLDKALRVEDLARLARQSQSYFTRAFGGSFGCPPHRFITRCRVERAKELMLEAHVPLRQIAMECGFADQAHFSRIFLRFVGVSPARWRRALAAPPASTCRAAGTGGRHDGL
jgi:AraC family transcriptional regulator